MDHSRNAFGGLARFRYAARGVVYMLLGGLALFGSAAHADNSQGALSTLLSQPFGRFMLGFMAIGLIGFAAWRFAQGALNADQREQDMKNAIARVGKLVSAFAYLSLGGLAGAMALGLAGGGGEGTEENWTATLLSLPFGQWPCLPWASAFSWQAWETSGKRCRALTAND